MQIIVALVALPAVALLLALASRLEDGLRSRAAARAPHAPDLSALAAPEPLTAPAALEHVELAAAEPESSPASTSG